MNTVRAASVRAMPPDTEVTECKIMFLDDEEAA